MTSRPPLIRAFPATLGILLLIGAVFLVQESSGGSMNPLALRNLGANDPSLVLQDGQWWRLLTSTLMHIGLVHLLVNGWALWQLGRLAEITFGSALTLALFVFTGIAGSALTLLLPEKISAGASGAIFGLEGALVAFFLRHRSRLTPAGKQILGQLLLWSVAIMIFSFVAPGIDWLGHLGGFAAGILVGWALPPGPRRGAWTLGAAAVAMGLLVWAVAEAAIRQL